MTYRFEVHIRCAGCRRDSFLEVALPKMTGSVSTADIVRVGQRQIGRFTCSGCKGTTGRVAGVIEMKKTSHAKTMSPSQADGIAVRAFAFLAASEVRLARFLTETGIEQETVRRASRTPGFLRGVVDYILGDADVLADAVEALGVGPEVIVAVARSMTKPQQIAVEPAAKAKSGKAGQGGDTMDPYSNLPRRSLFGNKAA